MKASPFKAGMDRKAYKLLLLNYSSGELADTWLPLSLWMRDW